MSPMWGNVQSLFRSPEYIEKLKAIQNKKMANPQLSVRQEIQDLLEEEEKKTKYE
jgi:hypothetical protein